MRLYQADNKPVRANRGAFNGKGELMAFTAVSYNIQYGVGLDRAYDLDRIVAAIDGADIVCLQEVTRGYIKNTGVDMVAALQDAMPAHFVAFHPATDIDMGSALVDGRAINRRFQFGNMVLSRWPIKSSRGHLLPRTWRRKSLNLQRGALETTIDTPAGPIRFYSIHLDHLDARERMAQVRAVRRIALDYAATGGAITGARSYGLPDGLDNGDFMLMGDFNFEPGSDEYQLMIEGGAITDPTMADPGWSNRSAHGIEPVRRARLDYAFCNRALATKITDVRIDRAAEGSDHMPVWITISA